MAERNEAARRSRRRGGPIQGIGASHSGHPHYGADHIARQGAIAAPCAPPQYARATDLDSVIEAFIVDRAARGLSPRTIMWYREKLVVFRRYVTGAENSSVEQLTARTLRAYLLDLGRTHNAGGATAVFERCGRYCGGMSSSSSPRTGSALCTVCPPNVSLPPLQPVPLADVRSMVATCSNDTFEDLRDRAVLLGLLDTGCRASEFVAFAVGDIHLGTGEATVRNGKGGKSRAVLLGTTARVALRAYLAVHPCPEPLSPLWVSRDGGPLAYSGLRELLRRRAGGREFQPHPSTPFGERLPSAASGTEWT